MHFLLNLENFKKKNTNNQSSTIHLVSHKKRRETLVSRNFYLASLRTSDEISIDHGNSN